MFRYSNNNFPEQPLDPPEDPGDYVKMPDSDAEIIVDFDTIIELDSKGDYVGDTGILFADSLEDYEYLDPEYDLPVDDEAGVDEKVWDMVVLNLPMHEGTFRISGRACLYYNLSVEEYRYDYSPGWDGEVDYESELGEPDVDYIRQKSYIENFKIVEL